MAKLTDSVLEMGFDESRVDWALRETGSNGLQAAIDHLDAHQDDDVPPPGEVRSGVIRSSLTIGRKRGQYECERSVWCTSALQRTTQLTAVDPVSRVRKAVQEHGSGHVPRREVWA